VVIERCDEICNTEGSGTYSAQCFDQNGPGQNDVIGCTCWL
jgi:hypothetical protein